MRPQDIEAIIREALNRYETGRLKHGNLDLTTDKRDFIREVEQELLDCINYCVFQILRLRGIKKDLIYGYKTVTGICRARSIKAL